MACECECAAPDQELEAGELERAARLERLAARGERRGLSSEVALRRAALVRLVPALTWRVAPPHWSAIAIYYAGLIAAWPGVVSGFRQVVERRARVRWIPASGALLAALAGFLGTHGVRLMLVGVLAVNESARAFYENVGGVLLGKRDFNDSGILLDEVVYVWENLTRMLEGRPDDPVNATN